MSSPFGFLANLTCIFHVPYRDFEQQGEGGIPTVPTREEVVIAYVTQQFSTNSGAERLMHGVEDAIFLTGNWVTPIRAFPSLMVEQTAEAVMWDRSRVNLPSAWNSVDDYRTFLRTNEAAITLEGTFLYLPSAPSVADSAVGSVFRGNLKLRSTYAETF